MNSKVQNVLLGVLAVGLIGITVAYAALTQQLTINGTAKVAATKWDVHFAKLSAGAATGYASTDGKTLAIAGDKSTSIEGNLGTLRAPGDTITYTFDIANAGNINAVIDSVTGGQGVTCTSTTQSVADAVCKELTYSIKYTDGNSIAKGDKLAKATNSTTPTTKNVTLTLTYKATAESASLPSEDVTVTANGMTINYVQDANN